VRGRACGDASLGEAPQGLGVGYPEQAASGASWQWRPHLGGQRPCVAPHQHDKMGSRKTLR
jgi:hypothetical protein